MKKIRVPAFETTDGEVFLDEFEAKEHQEMLDSTPSTWAYSVRLRLEVQTVWDLEINPEDPELKSKARLFAKEYLKEVKTSSLRSAVSCELSYADVVTDPELVSVECYE